MKSILYVGATLMIGASIYGFVDYKQTQRKKEFREMYTADVTKTPVVDQPAEPKITEPVEKKDIVVSDKKEPAKKQAVTKKVVKKKKKKISRELFSRAPIREEINFASEPEKKAKESRKPEKKD